MFKNKKLHFLVSALFILMIILLPACTSSSKKKSGSGASAKIYGIDDFVNIEWFLEEFKTGSQVTKINRTQKGNDFSDYFSLLMDWENISGTGAPNRYNSWYKTEDGNGMYIGVIRRTLMATFVEPEELKEYQFFTFLEKVNKWKYNGEKLELYTVDENDKETVLVFLKRVSESDS